MPLHEAASRGHLDVIHVLLSFNAPIRPRTAANDIPSALALRNGHFQVATFLGKNKIF